MAGGTLVTLGLARLAYGLIEGPAIGWSSLPVLAALVLGGVLLTGFVGREQHTQAPILLLHLFTHPVHRDEFGDLRGLRWLGGALFLLSI